MSVCLSNMPISHPLPYKTGIFKPNPKNCQTQFCNLARVTISGRARATGAVKSMAVQGRGNPNLDPPQRPNKQQVQKRPAPAAPLGLWDRFPTARTLQQMMETMERIMDDPFAYRSQWSSQTDDLGYSSGRTPWEITEDEKEYKMRFDIPGMSKEDVRIWVEEKMLVVKAEKKGEKVEEEKDGEWEAMSYGKYHSRIALPENVEFEKIKAEVKDGVLYISVPKASNGPKVFDINVK